ncbi:MAG: hypothetical protein H0U44_11135 [Flavisolibacter sp.]|jgi:hypothetical protein|nr:hypothetical protein [Flavisolibacter sp.]
MARIFTTSFEFNHQIYDAIVTVVNQNNNLNFTIKVMDMELQQLLPKGGIQYKGFDGFETVSVLDNTLSQSLMRSISRSIVTHLSD